MVAPFEQAWLLLKAYDFYGDLPPDYYNTLPDRMIRLIEEGGMEHVSVRPTQHYIDRKRDRYHPDQDLPYQFQRRGLKQYGFTIEDIMTMMANDLIENHPELKEVLNQKLPPGDQTSDLPHSLPSVAFNALTTDMPKVDSSEKQMGLGTVMTPHFVMDKKTGKLVLATVGHRPLNDRTRQTIKVTPTTSLENAYDNTGIHETLPERFDFLERQVPAEMQQEPQEPEQAVPQSLMPRERDYSNIPEAFRAMVMARDEANKMLKADRKLMYDIRDLPTGPSQTPAWQGYTAPDEQGDTRQMVALTPYGLKFHGDSAMFRTDDQGMLAPADRDFGEETVGRLTSRLAPVMAHEVGHALDAQQERGSKFQTEMPAHVLEQATREAMHGRQGYAPQPILPKAYRLTRDRFYDQGTNSFILPEDDPDYQYDITDDRIITGEPMDMAWRLLKKP